MNISDYGSYEQRHWKRPLNVLGPCLCFLKRLGLNAGGGVERGGVFRNAPTEGERRADDLGV